jgi:hypothetical protein
MCIKRQTTDGKTLVEYQQGSKAKRMASRKNHNRERDSHTHIQKRKKERERKMTPDGRRSWVIGYAAATILALH